MSTTTTTAEQEAIYDMADRLTMVLSETPQTPSTLARRAAVRTVDTYAALRWMVANAYAVEVGNGCRAKYRIRRFGEVAR